MKVMNPKFPNTILRICCMFWISFKFSNCFAKYFFPGRYCGLCEAIACRNNLGRGDTSDTKKGKHLKNKRANTKMLFFSGDDGGDDDDDDDDDWTPAANF